MNKALFLFSIRYLPKSRHILFDLLNVRNLISRFVKNLDPSQISLKFLKGEGELLNLELNEKVLTELLELPPWLQLKKAICNRICAKVVVV